MSKIKSYDIRYGVRNHTSAYTGTETAADLNPSNAFAVTLRASFISYAKSFSYTGSAQTWTVPYDGYYKIELWGASSNTVRDVLKPGYGAYSSGYIKSNSNNVFYLFIGGQGIQSTIGTAATKNGGWNGGGNAYDTGTCEMQVVSGGGATDLRIVSGFWNTANSLRSRIIVAGAGGGSYQRECYKSGGAYGGDFSRVYGGNGGGLTGLSPSVIENYGYHLAQPIGGSQIDGGKCVYPWYSNTYCTDYTGSFGQGGMYKDGYGWSGGGSGWYGGASGEWRAGSGGSSYISGHTGSVGVTSTSDSSPKSGCTTGTTNNACSITPYINPATGSGYTFTNTVMIDGAGYAWTNTKGSLQQMPNPNGGYYASGVGHSGNGAARITYLGTVI